MEKNYTDYTVEEFVEDESFFNCVRYSGPEAAAFWETFQQQHPEKQAAIAEARTIIASLLTQDAFSKQEKEELWNRVQTSMNETTVSPAKQGILRKLVISVSVAAGLLLLAGLPYIWYNYYRTVSIASGITEKKNVILPDGSTVVLNRNSTISYKAGWRNGGVREVWLNGEAFFEVVHLNRDTLQIKEAERFIVHASTLDVEVLGTSFNVYDREGNTNVSLNPELRITPSWFSMDPEKE